MKRNLRWICNWSLLLLLPCVVVSSLWLEFEQSSLGQASSRALSTWLHVVLTALLMLCVSIHLWLHWGHVRRWWGRMRNSSVKRPRGLSLFVFLTLLTGVASVPQWLVHGHTGLGGVHGKIGLIAGCLMLVHALKHRKWY